METRTAELLHDLRAPLQLIFSCAQLLQTELKNDGNASDYVEMLMVSAAEMQRMLNGALEVRRSGEPVPRTERCDLAARTRSIVQSTAVRARELGIDLVFSGDVHRLDAAVDEEMYRRILWNLLNNALRFTPPGGRIELKLCARGECVEISVSDTGCGVPADRLEAIFRPGVTEGGFGYGLSIARKYARAMGGELWAESRPGRGSTFRLLLPVGSDEGGASRDGSSETLRS